MFCDLLADVHVKPSFVSCTLMILFRVLVDNVGAHIVFDVVYDIDHGDEFDVRYCHSVKGI